MDSYNPIVALISNYPNYDGSLSEHVFSYSMDGHYTTVCSSNEDLFIIAPEEELTEFEAALMEFVNAREPKNRMTPEGAKNNGSILLNIAREQFIKEGYIIEKKTFHDAVKKVDPEVMKEVFNNVDKIEQFNFVKKKQKCEDNKYVDLGLPSGTKWATCNVGASKPEESGDYLTYDETTALKNVKVPTKKTVGRT